MICKCGHTASQHVTGTGGCSRCLCPKFKSGGITRAPEEPSGFDAFGLLSTLASFDPGPSTPSVDPSPDFGGFGGGSSGGGGADGTW